MTRLCSLLLLVCAVGACDGDPGRADAAGCTADDECSNGVFCDGVELCAPDAAGTDVRGCLPAEAPSCGPDEVCDERAGACVSCDPGDADGDGQLATACGGADCDDTDAGRFAGNPEVCDLGDRDEDCDPITFGVRDADFDSTPDAACCNVDPDGERRCGADCDDTRADVNPRQPEACDERDNDCDGVVDEGTVRTWWADVDMDGFGDPAGSPTTSCDRPVGTASNDRDCDDTDGRRNPSAPEVCDGLDNDCDGALDGPGEDDDGDGFADACAGVAETDCDDDRADVYPGAPETCDGVDTDCTEGGAASNEDADGDAHAPASAPCEGGFPRDDCDDTRATAFLGALELCNARDDDCDGEIDDEPGASSACSLPGASARCSAGACEVASCATDRGDCNTTAADGCEVDLASDASNCGACDRSCGTVGVCVDARCDAITSVSAELRVTCAVRETGAVLCWGANQYGTLGPGAAGDSGRPVLVTGIGGAARAIAVTGEAACAVLVDGGVRCWGASFAGALGSGGSASCAGICTGPPCTCSRDPLAVPGLARITAVDAGAEHFCALDQDGAVWCWGRNDLGQLGRGTTSVSETAGAVPGITGALALAVGSDGACVVRSDRQIACWGANAFGQLGNGAAATSVSSPVLVAGIADATDVAMGFGHACAVRLDQTVWCWGRNAEGELARAGADSLAPVAIAGVSGAALVEAGGATNVVVLSSGRLLAWGGNGSGAVGDGGLVNPMRVPFLLPSPDAAVNATTGGEHACAWRASGPDAVWCWGDGSSGQAGTGRSDTRQPPARVLDLP